MSQKILFLYGTETNTAERAANHLVKQLKFSLKDVTIEGPLAGNKMTDFEEIKKYDAVLIATSSYGDGDAPSCYDKVGCRGTESGRKWGGTRMTKHAPSAWRGLLVKKCSLSYIPIASSPNYLTAYHILTPL